MEWEVVIGLEIHDDDLVGSPIVNEQHRGLVATINSLYYFMQQGWDLESLRPTILMIAGE